MHLRDELRLYCEATGNKPTTVFGKIGLTSASASNFMTKKLNISLETERKIRRFLKECGWTDSVMRTNVLKKHSESA